MEPVNKYCTQCSQYNGNDPDFYEKYGELGCSGISFSSGEFPADQKLHCFTEEKMLTYEERHNKRLEEIKNIIQNNTLEQAAKLILGRFM